MDSKIDYNNYKADSLLNDAYFLESEQHPTPESIMFWDKLAQENKQLAKEIAIARNFLHILRHVPKPYLPQQKVDSIWKCISDQNRLEISKPDIFQLNFAVPLLNISKERDVFYTAL
jgi:hypothetical protein